MNFVSNRIMKSGGLVSLLHILIVWLCSAIIMVIVYPQLLVDHEISHIRFVGPERFYMGSFTFLSNMYHGGIQLWNPYDLMPLMFSYINGDIFSVSQFTGALIYPIVSLFYGSTGKVFHAINSTAPFLTISLFQIIGVYLLLRRFSARFIVLLPCTIIGSTLLSANIYFEPGISALSCLFPLLIHFILRFFEDFRLNDALLAFIVMLVCAGTNPFLTLGYFYQSVHYFILCGLVWSVVGRDSILKKCFNRKTWRPNRFTFVKIGLTLVLCVVIMGPWIVLVLENYYDYQLGVKGSRMENMFSINEYFKRPFFGAAREDFFLRSLDYGTNLYERSWHFLGFGTLFLALCGLVLNRDKRKFIFFGSILFIWLMNGPRTPISGTPNLWMDLYVFDIPSFLAHLVNALTNPTKALARSYHMSVFFMAYFILPLVAMGLESFFAIVDKRQNKAFIADTEIKKVGYVAKFGVFKNVSGLLVYRLTVGIVIGLLLVELPTLLKHQSISPVYLDQYSARAVIYISVYCILILSMSFLMISSKKIYSLISRLSTANTRQRLLLVGVVTLLMVSSVSVFVAKHVMLYLLISTFISFIIIFLLATAQEFNRRLPLVALLLLTLFAIDISNLSKWMELHSSRVMMGATSLPVESWGAHREGWLKDSGDEGRSWLVVPGLERFGEVGLDFQNPEVLPFREYYNPGTVGQIPHFMTVNSYNMQGLFSRYTNLGKFTVPAVNRSSNNAKNKMRHVAFDTLHQKRAFQVYLNRDHRIFFQAQFAIKDTPGVFDEILRQGLDRTIIVIDHVPEQGPYVSSLPAPLRQALKPLPRKFNNYHMMVSEADMTNEGELTLYWFDLPEEFSKHLTTSIYTRDSDLLGVKVDDRMLIPAQGRLVSPYTFDVQNIAGGKLVIALPRSQKWDHNKSAVFRYPAQNEKGITRVWRYKPDELGLDYVAEEDGWFVMHYPFDEKWKVTIDGKPSEIYKANYGFMALPISKGNHSILLQYWPDTYIRFFLALSYLTILVTLGTVFYIGIKEREVNLNFRTVV